MTVEIAIMVGVCVAVSAMAAFFVIVTLGHDQYGVEEPPPAPDPSTIKQTPPTVVQDPAKESGPQSIDEPTAMVPSTVTVGDISNSHITVGNVGEKYAREHCHFLASNGHDLSHLVLMGPLYHEAVDALRRGELPVNSGPDSADAIDDWVARRLLESQIVPFVDEKCKDVVIGDLYRQAVDLLRQGKIPLLGAKNTADKIEQWVRREQLKRCGVKL